MVCQNLHHRYDSRDSCYCSVLWLKCLLSRYLSVIYIFKEQSCKCRFLFVNSPCFFLFFFFSIHFFFYWLWLHYKRLFRFCVFMCFFQWWVLRACRLKTELVPVIRMWRFRLARLRREPKLSTVTLTLCGRRRLTCESNTIFSVLFVLLESCFLLALFLFSFLFNVIRQNLYVAFLPEAIFAQELFYVTFVSDIFSKIF